MLDRISYQTALDMIVQHFYCKGLYRILDTAHIPATTVTLLKNFQLKEPGFLTQVPYPGTEMNVNVCNYEHYNMFWIFKYNRWVSCNICSYDAAGEKEVLALFGRMKFGLIRKPTLSQFIYTMPIYWSDLSTEEVPQVEQMTFALYNSFSMAYLS